jgi:hypothetical protein
MFAEASYMGGSTPYVVWDSSTLYPWETTLGCGVVPRPSSYMRY